RLKARRLRPGEIPQAWAERVLGSAPPTREMSAFELLRRPEVSYEALRELVGPGEHESPETLAIPAAPGPVGSADTLHPALLSVPDARLIAQVRRGLEVEASYAGYIERAE